MKKSRRWVETATALRILLTVMSSAIGQTIRISLRRLYFTDLRIGLSKCASNSRTNSRISAIVIVESAFATCAGWPSPPAFGEIRVAVLQELKNSATSKH
jgi:hypothetical protein